MTTTPLRCPECSSLVRAGSPWCSLCHADVRSDEEKAAALAETALLEAAVESPLHEPVPAGVEAAGAGAQAPRGRHARPSTLPLSAHSATSSAAAAGSTALATAPGSSSAPVAESDGPASSTETEDKIAELKQAGVDVDGMLQLLASTSGTDPLNGLVERLSSKGSRAVAVLVAAAALTAIGIGLMFLLGTFFG